MIELPLGNASDVLTQCKMGDTVSYRNGIGELKQGRVNGWRRVNYGTVREIHAALIAANSWKDHIVPIDNIVAIVKR